MRTLPGLLPAIVVWVATSTLAVGDDWFERFQLWTQCHSVSLEVYVQAPADLGLEGSQVATAARSRLRAARIYVNPSDVYWIPPRLWVSVLGVPKVHNGSVVAACVEVRFEKIFEDFYSDNNHFATTWRRSFVLSYSDASHIISIVSQLMDEFIDEYLKVNGAACDARSSTAE